VSHFQKIRQEKKPTFSTILAVSKLVEGLAYEEKQKLKYSGPCYFDWDGADIDDVIPKVHALLEKLQTMELDFDMVSLFATGGKGFHLEIPEACFMPKVVKEGVQYLPTIYREVALTLIVDTLDMRVYSQGRGRQWREPNKLRDNGRYKVPITYQEMMEMTGESYLVITSAPRILPAPKPPELCLDLSILYQQCFDKVTDKIKKRGKTKTDPNAKAKASSPSIGLMMMGQGIKDTASFNEVAMQLGIAANTAGMKLAEFLEACTGLIESELLEWNRYNTPDKRRTQLADMFHYTHENPCYEFSIGAIKSLLFHDAPDLDGIQTTLEDVQEGIVESKQVAGEVDEYADVAGGVNLSKFGTYVTTEFGKKRVCAVSFTDSALLRSTDSGQITGYETNVLINGKPVGRQTLEMDVFSSTQVYNRFCSKYGHAFQGSEPQLKATMMRFVEQAKKKGGEMYVTKREGLDVINVPNHEDPAFRKPFLIWADDRGVLLQPHMQGKGMDLKFQGYPDPRGVFQTDLRGAPVLSDWSETPENREAIKETLQSLMSCQAPEMLGKLLGWHTACFYKQLFHKTYNQFPLLHVTGSAGSGKTSMILAIQPLFYLNQEVKMLTPSSTKFGIEQFLTGSASIPVIIDEYKPWEMAVDKKNAFRLMLRDSYNGRNVVKGGGTRENEDYRSLHSTQMAAPVTFISEAVEDETAILERVVLLTVVKPPASVNAKWLGRFRTVQRNKEHLSMLGMYFASDIIEETTMESFQTEFDELYAKACYDYLINDNDLKGNISDADLRVKQNAKERSVFNHSVALFGFKQFRRVVNLLLDDALDEMMEGLESTIYVRMSDLSNSTMPEYLKTLNLFSTMSHHLEADRTDAIRQGFEFAFSNKGDKDTLELSVKACYLKYRAYCRSVGMAPLFSGPDSFVYAIKDSPALISMGLGKSLTSPGIATFDMGELLRMGIEPFRGGM